MKNQKKISVRVPSSLLAQGINIVRHSSAIRGTAYLGSCVAVLEIVRSLQDLDDEYALEKLHLSLFPLVAGLTQSFSSLRPEDRKPQTQTQVAESAKHLLKGVGLGSGAALAMFGVMALKGWVDAPDWGWKQSPLSEVLRSAGFISLGHAAVAWNEEQIFRGYGYETLREAMPPMVAASLLTVLFGFYHGFDVRRALAISVGGLALMLLRVQSGNIWLPIGYHWAWNVLQTAVFGPVDSPPSVRPIQVHGPSKWVGSPGSPEPGALATLIALAVALGAAGLALHQHQKKLPRMSWFLSKVNLS